MTPAHEIAPAAHPLPGIAAAIPVLRTARLTLRATAIADFRTLRDIDESVADDSIGGPRSREESWYDFAQMTATWIWRGHGWWTIENGTDVCGFVGIGFEPGDREPELGYLLTPSARGKGYATEAAMAARDFARDTADLPALVSYITTSNTASRNVARKLGAHRDDVAEAALGIANVQVWRHWGEAA